MKVLIFIMNGNVKLDNAGCSSFKQQRISYRNMGIMFIFGAMSFMVLIEFVAKPTLGMSDAILGLYYSGHISASQAGISLTGLGIPSGIITGYLFSTAGYIAFLDGTTVVFIRYSIIDVLGPWALVILGAIIGAAA